jgi:hypothetical protein
MDSKRHNDIESGGAYGMLAHQKGTHCDGGGSIAIGIHSIEIIHY